MRIVTWNIARLGGLEQVVERYGSLLKFLNALQIDILCVQETKVSHERLINKDPLVKPLAVLEGFESFWSGSRASGTRSGHAGVATFVREKWSPLEAVTKDLFGDKELDDEGRVVMTDHGSFVLLNVYVPNAGEAPARERLPQKMRFLNYIRNYAQNVRSKGKNIIIAGDLNIARTQDDVYAERARTPFHGYSQDELSFIDNFVCNLDSNSGQNGSSESSKQSMQSLTVKKEGSDMVDVWRSCHKGIRNAFSVWDWYTKARERNIGARIDYILLDQIFYNQYADPALTSTISDSTSISTLSSSSSSSSSSTSTSPPVLTTSSSTILSEQVTTSPRFLKIAEINLKDLAALSTTTNSAFYVDTPVEWSDHIPLVLTMLDPPLPPTHGPCAESSKRVKYFAPEGKNIMTMFKKQALASAISSSNVTTKPNIDLSISASNTSASGDSASSMNAVQTVPISHTVPALVSAPSYASAPSASAPAPLLKVKASSKTIAKPDNATLLTRFFAPTGQSFKRASSSTEDNEGGLEQDKPEIEGKPTLVTPASPSRSSPPAKKAKSSKSKDTVCG
jgi:exodeoxyribonuclease III